jgi:hypothetical protein
MFLTNRRTDTLVFPLLERIACCLPVVFLLSSCCLLVVFLLSSCWLLVVFLLSSCCLLAVFLLSSCLGSCTCLGLGQPGCSSTFFFTWHLLTPLFMFSLSLTALVGTNPTREAEVRRYTQATSLRLRPSLSLQPVGTRALQSDLVASSAPLNLWIETTTPTPRDLHCLT